MLCHAQAAKPVFPYGPFKLQCVFERSEIHTKGTSLPEAGINRVLATVTTTHGLKPVQGCLFELVVTSEKLSL